MPTPTPPICYNISDVRRLARHDSIMAQQNVSDIKKDEMMTMEEVEIRLGILFQIYYATHASLMLHGAKYSRDELKLLLDEWQKAGVRRKGPNRAQDLKDMKEDVENIMEEYDISWRSATEALKVMDDLKKRCPCCGTNPERSFRPTSSR